MTPMPKITGPVKGGFSVRPSNAESVAISWCYNVSKSLVPAISQVLQGNVGMYYSFPSCKRAIR